jgi:hypothetical protein
LYGSRIFINHKYAFIDLEKSSFFVYKYMYKNVAHIYVSKSSDGGFEMFKFFQLKTLGGK